MKLTALKRLSKPLVYRDFRLLWIGQSISSLGSSLQLVALPWLILQAHGSPLDLTAAMLALAIPQALLTVVGGVITDRLDARTVMLWADFARILTAGLVAKEDLDGANSLSSLMSELGSILGVLPAGLLVASGGPAFAFALNSCSYMVAVVAARRMRSLERLPREQDGSPFQDAWLGFRYLGTLPWLVTMLLMDMLSAVALVGPSSVGLPLIARNVLHVGAQGYSLLIWSFSCGSILGMLLPAFYRFQRHRGLICVIFQGIESLLIAAIAIAPLPLASLCLIGWSLLNGILVILTMSLIQMRVAKNMLGRVMSFWMLATTGFIPLSELGAGLIASATGPQWLFVGAGGVMLIGSVLGICVPALRRLD